MSRAVSLLFLVLVAVWAVAHLFHLGPIQTASGLLIAWVAALVAASAVIASLTVLIWGVILGRTTPPWLRFVGQARTLAAVLGSALVVLGLLHYRDTEPDGEIAWVVAGLVVLVAAGIIHVWLLAAERRNYLS